MTRRRPKKSVVSALIVNTPGFTDSDDYLRQARQVLPRMAEGLAADGVFEARPPVDVADEFRAIAEHAGLVFVSERPADDGRNWMTFTRE